MDPVLTEQKCPTEAHGLSYKLDYLQNENTLLSEENQILNAVNQQYRTLITSELDSVKLGAIQESLKHMAASFDKKMKDIAQRNHQLNAELLLVKQTALEEVNFLNETIQRYEIKIFELRMHGQQKENILQTYELREELMREECNHPTFNPTFILKTNKSSLQHLQQKQIDQQIILRLEQQRLQNQNVIVLSQEDESHVCSSKNLKNFPFEHDKTRPSYSDVTNHQLKEQEGSCINAVSKRCRTCADLLLDLRMTQIKLSKTLSILKGKSQQLLTEKEKCKILQQAVNAYTQSTKGQTLKATQKKTMDESLVSQEIEEQSLFAEVSGIGELRTSNSAKRRPSNNFDDFELFDDEDESRVSNKQR